jgi:hypothetical protein
MNNPAFIVDGPMEKLIINHLCPNHPVRILNCNGRDVKIEAAAKRMASLIRILKRYYPIVIIFDREDRQTSSESISAELLEKIKENGIQGVDIFIGVPDTMMENWMLADVKAINRYYFVNIKQDNYEGKNGKSQIKQAIRPKTYSETEDGPEIAKLCSLKNTYQNSVSFRNFYEKIQGLNCLSLGEGGGKHGKRISP